eukprot:Tbor_TRINITY_DN3680_c0_g1::TRINITY_DN3680_c0_g1_i1::g.215::m.215/K05756/ARPC3; actin related protein 2/3 complex, subunit 3
MSSYHSIWNGYEEETLLGCGVYKIKQTHKASMVGPAPSMSLVDVDEEGNQTEAEDILDEALYYFKSNVLFKTFKMKGDADRLILFLTHYLHTLLKKIVRMDIKAAKAVVLQLQTEYSVLPTDASFPFAVFFSLDKEGPVTTDEKERFTEYSKQIRYEIGMRMIDKVYQFPEADGTGSKHWMLFTRHHLLPPKK